ncbi:60S ribosomal protein L28 [Cyclospora cayetanensis]|uniref:Ribosomal protein rpl28 n=2 Tax=Cyclospora cayetanensis TaxID=88456 RepID=A0A1D3D2B1_9EIME|nr:60S ribosomal protein L28 [Cyclospora cayetanensis]OEH77577.1 ribosomal protein rpl28 [Cyclospora cayetanensis]
MVSAELLWQCVKKTNCFLKKSNGIILTSEPLNLTQKNTLRHSGLCHKQPVGLSLVGNNCAVKLSYKQKAGRKMRYPKRVIASKKFPKTHKKTKEIQRLVAAQRPDLVRIAEKRFHKMCKTSPIEVESEEE